MSGGSTAFSAKEKEEDVVVAGENATQEERLIPIRMVDVVKTVRAMVLSFASCDDTMI